MSRARYGEWRGGDDPLAPPYDVSDALDQLGDSILDGLSPAEAFRALTRRGLSGRRGLEDLMRDVRNRQREARQAGRLDGTLERVRELLDQALDAERRALFPDPGDDARLAEAELDALPQQTARAVRELNNYNWRSPEARAAYDEIQDLLKREVLDSQFRGMKQALEGADPEAQQRVKDMLAALNDMLEADARGEDVSEQFEQFMQNFGDFFPDNPQNLEELVDSLAQRAAAAQRLLNSLSPEQQAELAVAVPARRDDNVIGAVRQRARVAWRGRAGPTSAQRQNRQQGDEPAPHRVMPPRAASRSRTGARPCPRRCQGIRRHRRPRHAARTAAHRSSAGRGRNRR